MQNEVKNLANDSNKVIVTTPVSHLFMLFTRKVSFLIDKVMLVS